MENMNEEAKVMADSLFDIYYMMHKSNKKKAIECTLVALDFTITQIDVDKVSIYEKARELIIIKKLIG